MLSRIPDQLDCPDGRSVALPFSEDVAELSLLLPTWQVSALNQSLAQQAEAELEILAPSAARDALRDSIAYAVERRS